MIPLLRKLALLGATAALALSSAQAAPARGGEAPGDPSVTAATTGFSDGNRLPRRGFSDGN